MKIIAAFLFLAALVLLFMIIFADSSWLLENHIYKIFPAVLVILGIVELFVTNGNNNNNENDN